MPKTAHRKTVSDREHARARARAQSTRLEDGRGAAGELTRLRALARAVLLIDGTPLSPTTVTPAGVDDLIGDLVGRRDPSLDRLTESLYACIDDPDLHRDVRNHGGVIMAAYGDGGYYVGLAVGLELASLLLGSALAVPTKKGGLR